MEKIKICRDGFIWRLISSEDAISLYVNCNTEIYQLYDDETEALVDSFEDLKSSAARGGYFGIEVGYFQELAKEYYSNYERKLD